MREPTDPSTFGRVVQELLRLEPGVPSELEDVAEASHCSVGIVANILENVGVSGHGPISIQTEHRLWLAREAARRGIIDSATKFLDWREFEAFAENCLTSSGFETMRNTRVKDRTRAWQIDVIGIQTKLALCIDCKHWNTPSYPSKYARAAERQTHATRVFLDSRENEGRIGVGLPVLLTLFEPRVKTQKGAVILSASQLPDFLVNVTPYSEGLPFLLVD